MVAPRSQQTSKMGELEATHRMALSLLAGTRLPYPIWVISS